AGGPEAQLRGFWVHVLDDALKSRSGIDRVLDAAARANLNTIVVQAARRHDAFYDSDVLPRTSDPEMPPGLDLLGRLIPAAHARGLEVHVWFSVMPTYHTLFEEETLPADHIYRLHGPNGSQGSWMAASVESNYGMLDPGIPGVQDHVAAMTREVVERYDVDGIHLDYLRYATGGSRMNPIAEERYRRVGGGMSLDDFRRRQTEDLARRVYLEVAAADPTVALSMAAIAQGEGPTGSDLRASFRGTRAYREKFQDWPTWLDRGIMDMVFPMIYFQESRYGGWYDQWTRFLASLPNGIRAVGQGSYLNPVSSSLAQLDDALAATHGAVLYSYQLDSSDGQGKLLSSLASSRFRAPAPAPDVAAKTRPTRGHVLAIARDGQTVVAAPATGGEPVRMRTDATGRAGFVGLAPGRWTVGVEGARPVVVEVTAGQVTTTDVR
ncbi:MAG: family 10 glycosylhydrolase, partial [Actinobacteria bacterium]|nr:family 10 glycosylhydrolase [Actinomycetota bacterium]